MGERIEQKAILVIVLFLVVAYAYWLYSQRSTGLTGLEGSQVSPQTLDGWIKQLPDGQYTFSTFWSCDTFICNSTTKSVTYLLYVQPSVQIDLQYYVGKHVQLTGVVGHNVSGNLMIMISTPPTIVPTHG